MCWETRWLKDLDVLGNEVAKDFEELENEVAKDLECWETRWLKIWTCWETRWLKDLDVLGNEVAKDFAKIEVLPPAPCRSPTARGPIRRRRGGRICARAGLQNTQTH